MTLSERILKFLASSSSKKRLDIVLALNANTGEVLECLKNLEAQGKVRTKGARWQLTPILQEVNS